MAIKPKDLETHPTRCNFKNIINGRIIPLWKDYEFPAMKLKFVYYTTGAPGTTKGPYMHTKRNGLVSVIQGKVILVYKETLKDKAYQELTIDADKKPQSIYIPKNTPHCFINIGQKELVLVNICDYAWKPGDNEDQKPDFSDYDFSKTLRT